MRPLLLGHRGARRSSPENTLAAFQRALDHGCDGFEFDLRQSSDAHCVVCHDPKLAGRVVERSTYDSLLAAHRRRNPGCREDECPTLLDVVLQKFSAAFLDVELKVGGIEEAVLRLLRAHPPRRFLVSSFLPEVIARCRELDPSLPLGLICEDRKQLARWEKLPIQAVFAHRKLVTRELVSELHAAGQQVFVWTVNDEREMRRLAELGVAGLISDDSELLGKVFT